MSALLRHVVAAVAYLTVSAGPHEGGFSSYSLFEGIDATWLSTCTDAFYDEGPSFFDEFSAPSS